MLLLVLTHCAGCSRRADVAEVEGTVCIDGRPLENILVVFLPDPSEGTDGPAARGVTDAAGHYRLHCDDQRDGAVVGWHRVVLEDLTVYAAPRDEETTAAPVGGASRVPPTYSSSAATLLRVKVPPSGTTYDIEIR